MTSASRVLSRLMKIVAGLIALVVIAYVVTNLFSLGRGWHQRGQLADEFAADASAALPDLRERQAALAEQAGRAPDHAWVAQACDFATDDSGWMVNNYREQCGLRAVSAWQVESAEAGRQLLTVTPPESPLRSDSCETLGSLADDKARVSVALAGRDARHSCGVGLDYGAQSRAIDGDVETLDVDATWLVVVENTDHLIDADIGCAHWSVLFCDNPFTGHAWADIK